MTTDAAEERASSAAAGQAGPARKLGRRLTLRWSQAPDGGTYQRRRADALMAAVGLGVLVVCGVLAANRTVIGAGAGLGVFIGGALNLVFGVPSGRISTAGASG